MVFCFITHLFLPLDILCSLPQSSKYAYAFPLSAANCFIIFPPNSSLKRPGAFLLEQLDASNHFLTSLEISSKKSLVLM